MKSLPAICAAFMVVSLFPAAAGNHVPNHPGPPACYGNVVEIGGLIYIDDRDFIGGEGTWIYLESNGIPGLQRGGTSPAHTVGQVPVPVLAPNGTFSSAEICTDSGTPDTLLF